MTLLMSHSGALKLHCVYAAAVVSRCFSRSKASTHFKAVRERSLVQTESPTKKSSSIQKKSKKEFFMANVCPDPENLWKKKEKSLFFILRKTEMSPRVPTHGFVYALCGTSGILTKCWMASFVFKLWKVWFGFCESVSDPVISCSRCQTCWRVKGLTLPSVLLCLFWGNQELLLVLSFSISWHKTRCPGWTEGGVSCDLWPSPSSAVFLLFFSNL